MVYPYSVGEIVKSFSLRSITRFVIALPLYPDDVAAVLDSLFQYRHIVQCITVCATATVDLTHPTLRDFDPVPSPLPDCMSFNNKNKRISDQEYPDILAFVTQPPLEAERQGFEAFAHTYGINVRSPPLQPPGKKPGFIDSVRQSMTFLHSLFDEFRREESPRPDVIVQMNPSFFAKNKVFHIYYPLKDDVLYIDEAYNIVYGTANSMFLLFQVIMSNYFDRYIADKTKEKPALARFQQRKWYFEFVRRTFNTRPIT